MAIWQNWCLGQFYFPIIEVFQIAQLLALVILVSVSLVRENLRGLREILKRKIRAFATFNIFRLMKIPQGLPKLNECWVTWPGPDL